MNQKILVTYASRTESTAGMAEATGRARTKNGLQAGVRQMMKVNDLSEYGTIVAGSSVQGARWLPETMQFIEDLRDVFTSKTFAAYTPCMTLAMKNDEKYRQGVEQWLEPLQQLVQTVSEVFFAVILDIGRIHSFGKRIQFRISILLGIWKEGDHRDWNAINIWVENLARIFLNNALLCQE